MNRHRLFLLGHMLAIGDQIRLNITGPCSRCVMTTLPQGDLPKDPGILRTAAQHNRVNIGVYAAVQQSGTIQHDDLVRLAQSNNGMPRTTSRAAADA